MMINGSDKNLVAMRRCSCGFVTDVPVYMLKVKAWRCPRCIVAANTVEAKRALKVSMLRKKHAFDLRRPGYPWSKQYA